MTYKNIAAALCLVGLTFGANAGQLGFAHNQHLSCLLKINPTGQMPMHKVLQALVLKCRFNPGMPVNQFVKKYTPLTPRAVLSKREVNLVQVAKRHAPSLNRTQIKYLHEVKKTLRSNKPRMAARAMSNLYSKAKRELGDSKLDHVVLNALDIAEGSAEFWGKRGGGEKRAKWWQIVLADVAGGVVGGIFGGGVGAVGLGTACSSSVAG